MILKPVNFLILDEPTNHLDIESREALEEALRSYDGTILAVSHDRYFINALAERIVNFENKKLVSYAGGYDYFAEKRKTVEVAKEEKPKNLDYNEQKRIAAEKRKRENQIKRCEEKIAKLEEEIEVINNELNETGSDFEKAAELAKQLDEKNEELMEAYELWEELQ